ncbi:MAG TPA: plastocyanin/azurin family copper-binding protein [Solirubrobacterales bacterium]
MKKASALFVLILASVALVACGSSSNSTSSTTTESAPSSEATTGGSGGGSGGGETINVEADPGGELAYTTKSLTAKAGNVTIDFKNPQALMHDVAVEDSSGKVIGKTELVAEASSTASLENLKPGTYTFFCTVPGHREAGMEGTLTVK